MYRTGLLLRAPLLRTCWGPLRLGEFALKSWSACHTAGSGWNWQGWVVEPAVFRDLDDHAGQMRVRGVPSRHKPGSSDGHARLIHAEKVARAALERIVSFCWLAVTLASPPADLPVLHWFLKLHAAWGVKFSSLPALPGIVTTPTCPNRQTQSHAGQWPREVCISHLRHTICLATCRATTAFPPF